MKSLNIRLALGAMSIASAASVQAASDYLLRIDGIAGETEAAATLHEFRWTGAFDAQGGFDPFQPALAAGAGVRALIGDRRWESLALTASTPEGRTVYRYELQGVLVSSYSVSGHGDGSATPATGPWIRLESASGPIMSWAPPAAGGGRGDWVQGAWDPTTRGFVGDRAVFGAFADLGAARLADGSLAITGVVPEPGTWALLLCGLAATGFVVRRRVGLEHKAG